MTETPPGWDGYLEPGERILWQGRPAGTLSFRGQDLPRTIFGGFFLAFAIFWTLGAAAAASGDGLIGLLFPLFGVPFILAGLRLSGGTAFWNAYVRRHSWYTLSSRRAFIATELFRKRDLKSWPITPNVVIDLEEGPPDSVWFADRPGRRGRPKIRQRIGFEMISDGREVLHLMRQVQRGTA